MSREESFPMARGMEGWVFGPTVSRMRMVRVEGLTHSRHTHLCWLMLNDSYSGCKPGAVSCWALTPDLSEAGFNPHSHGPSSVHKTHNSSILGNEKWNRGRPMWPDFPSGGSQVHRNGSEYQIYRCLITVWNLFYCYFDCVQYFLQCFFFWKSILREGMGSRHYIVLVAQILSRCVVTSGCVLVQVCQDLGLGSHGCTWVSHVQDLFRTMLVSGNMSVRKT